LKELKHPHVVRCFRGKVEGSTGYIASELVDGETLAELLERRERLPWDQALDYAQAIAAALQGAGELGLTHQDLTPDKIIIAKDGRVNVADFRHDRINNPWCFTSRKKTLLRAQYQSPEQICAETQLTPKSDLYSLGCLLFHMVTGRPPFVADDIKRLRDE